MRIRIRDPNFLTLDQGSGMEKFGSEIRDKHPGSATLIKTKIVRPVMNSEERELDTPSSEESNIHSGYESAESNRLVRYLC
jgi:hypothetical protein